MVSLSETVILQQFNHDGRLLHAEVRKDYHQVRDLILPSSNCGTEHLNAHLFITVGKRNGVPFIVGNNVSSITRTFCHEQQFE